LNFIQTETEMILNTGISLLFLPMHELTAVPEI